MKVGWISKKLDEVCNLVSGSTPKGIDQVINQGSILFLRVSDMNLVGNEKYMRHSSTKLTDQELSSLKLKLIPKGTVIFPKRGGAILTNKKRIVESPAAIDLNIMGCIPKAGLCPNYLYYWFLKLDLGKIYDGSNVPQINNKNISPLEIPVPPLPIQRQIVARIEELFSELDAGVQELETALKRLKVYRQAVLHYYLNNPDWERMKMGKVLESITYGTSKKCHIDSGRIPVLRIPNIDEDGTISTNDLKYADFEEDEIKQLSLIEGDLLTIRSNGSVSLVGRVGQISKREANFLYAGYLIRLRLDKSKCLPPFIKYTLQSPNLRDQIESKAKSTSGVNNINSKELQNLDILVPSLDTQSSVVSEIEAKLSEADATETTIHYSLKQAEALRQSILKRAFEGRLTTNTTINELKEEVTSEPEEERKPVGSGEQLTLF